MRTGPGMTTSYFDFCARDGVPETNFIIIGENIMHVASFEVSPNNKI